jgi:hypothetical protein
MGLCIHDPGCRLPRMPLLRASVNKSNGAAPRPVAPLREHAASFVLELEEEVQGANAASAAPPSSARTANARLGARGSHLIAKNATNGICAP